MKKIKRCESFLIALINSGAAQVSFIIIANHFLLAWTNTLAFYAAEVIKSVKKFYDTGP